MGSPKPDKRETAFLCSDVEWGFATHPPLFNLLLRLVRLQPVITLRFPSNPVLTDFGLLIPTHPFMRHRYITLEVSQRNVAPT